ncbi:MAG: ankyrin repeat domain-containing protein [Proteobacteria bacterium]|nr:ankyrin repeat domain-containing protein [Pseudomonadota bacterium]
MIKPVDVSVKMSNGETLLILASRQGNLEIVKSLLENGARVNDISNEKVSPLYVASENGHKDIAELLMNSPWGDESNVLSCTESALREKYNHISAKT